MPCSPSRISGVTEINVESWDEVIEVLYDGSWNPGMQRHRSPYVYRGLDQATYCLETSLQRLAVNRPQWIAQMEAHLLRNFRKYAHRDIVQRDSVWHWLAMAQHHGLATRLMDWTYSPFVALHFATANQQAFGEDGVVWMIDHWKAQQDLPQTLLSQLSEIGSVSFDADLLSRHVETLPALRAFADQPSQDGFLLFFEPPSIDDRIVNQYALFSILSDPVAVLDDWLAQRPDVFKKIVIPASIKWEIRDKLDQSNLNERVMFPGLDGLSKWLNRNYYAK